MDDKTRVATLLDLDVLDCPICFEPLTVPTFQCDDGHLVCRFCFAKLDNKCPGPACDLPIGENRRCIAMEKVLDTVVVPCRNAELGCTNNFPYREVSSHEKECSFSPCSCPNFGCNYTGSYKSIYDHFVSNHSIDSKYFSFLCGHSFDVEMNVNDKNMLFLWECSEELWFAVQCFSERYGVYVTIRRIARSAPELRKFSYRLSCFVNGCTLTLNAPEVKMILEVNTQRPEESFLFVPHCLLQTELLKMKLRIKKSHQE